METAARPPPRSASSSPTHSALLRSLAKLVRLHRRRGSSNNDHDLGDDSRTAATGRSFFSFKPSRLKQSGPLDAASAYTRSEALHEDDVKRQNRGRETSDTVLAMVFAGVSAIKAAYAQLQLAQAPYDPEAVQAADVAVVAELKRISQIKHWYLSTKHHYHPTAGEDDGAMYCQQVQVQVQRQMLSPDAHVAAEILEMRSLIKTYQVTTKKLENELKRKEEEVARLGEELKPARNNAATNADCQHHHHRRHHHRSLSSSFSDFPGTADGRTALTPALFIDTLRRAVRSARSFTRELVREMHSAGWDVHAAAAAIEPHVGAGDEHLALQSFICRRMFSAFHYPQFKPGREKSKTCDIRRRRDRFLEDFVEMDQGSRSSVAFEEFLRDRYRAVVHPRMEAAFFGGGAHEGLSFPKHSGHHQPFFRCFHDLARRVWMLQRLFHAFEPEAAAAVFEVLKGSRFSDLYMQTASPGAEAAAAVVVGFTVVPGFKLRGTVLPCRVYLVAGEDGTEGCAG